MSPASLGLRILAAAVLTAPLAPAQTPAFSERGLESGVQFLHGVAGFTGWFQTGGGAVGDFNRDGWQDVFAVSGGRYGELDRLFINDQDGTFTDEAAAWGMTLVHKGKGAAVGDYDGNGTHDIYVVSAGPTPSGLPGSHLLWRNDGNASFTEVGVAAGVNFTAAGGGDGYGAAFGDYDLDGDLDLMVLGQTPQNEGSRLFRNDGDGTFTDVTDTIGLWNGITTCAGLAPRFADMDGDRYPELLLIGDYNTMQYFINDGDGTFTDFAGPSGIDDAENGMGNLVRDFDRDGLRDWYVTSIYFLQAGWTGNKLHLNNGNHTFTEIAPIVGLQDGAWGWGAVGVDVNHDTYLDIAETNGWSGSAWENDPAYLWMGQPNGTWVDTAQAAGLTHDGQGRGMVNLDYDNDGDQDFVIFSNNELLTFWQNDLITPESGTGPDTHWLRVFLDTSASPGLAPDGYGSIVEITFAGQTRTEFIDGGDNFLSMSELSAHFGLGTATLVDEVRVEWNDGTETVLRDVAADQTITIASGDGDGPWTDLGLGKPGTGALVPTLAGDGPLTALSSNTVTLSGALASTPTSLVVGFSRIDAPFKGGTLVPALDVVIALGTDAGGGLALPFTWPAGVPAGVELYWQHWIVDAGASGGLAASNALQSVTP